MNNIHPRMVKDLVDLLSDYFQVIVEDRRDFSGMERANVTILKENIGKYNPVNLTLIPGKTF